MKADLHCHSHYSDGKHSPAFLLERARQNQVTHLAITDHDCIDALDIEPPEDMDIQLIKAPVGYPARGVVTTPLIQRVQSGVRPKIPCISNCVEPCDHGKESNKVGYCIANALGDSRNGVYETGVSPIRPPV